MYSVNITCATGSEASVLHKMPEVPPPAGSKRTTQVHLTLYQGAVTQHHTTQHTRSYIATTFPDGSTRSTKADLLTVDLARRADQSPGRLVDEDGLRGLSTADRSGAERRDGLPCVGVCSPPGTAKPSTARRRLKQRLHLSGKIRHCMH